MDAGIFSAQGATRKSLYIEMMGSAILKGIICVPSQIVATSRDMNLTTAGES